MQRPTIAHILLLIGLVIVFAVFGIEKLVTPIDWIGWMPTWMDGLLGIRVQVWLTVIGVAELLIALLLVLPWRKIRRVGATLASLHLLGIVLSVGWNDIGVRDIGLLFASLALMMLL